MSNDLGGYSKVEKTLIVLAITFCVVCAGAYFLGFSFKRLTSGSGLVKVGELKSAQSVVRRQLVTEAEFRPIKTTAALYDEDTIATAEDGSAILELNDGSTLDLGPGAMIKLVFETNFELSGISRVAKVQVVSGRVVALAKSNPVFIRTRDDNEIKVAKNEQQVMIATPTKEIPPPSPIPIRPSPLVSPPPRPSPSPTLAKPVETHFEWLEPKPNAKLSIEDGSNVAEKQVRFSWSVTPDQPLKLTVTRVRGKTTEKVDEKIIASSNGEAAVIETLSHPGEYKWMIQNSSKLLGQGGFSVLRDFNGIELDTPWVAGDPTDSNRLKDDLLTDYELELRWKQFQGATSYSVAVGPKRLTTPASYIIVGKLGLTGSKVQYSVVANLSSGFVAHSPMGKFQFHFLSPNLVKPENHSKIKPGPLLLVWQKTNFTNHYEIEVSKDLNFKAIVFRRHTEENFASVKATLPAQYYWRVKSVSPEVQSQFSQPFHFSIAP